MNATTTTAPAVNFGQVLDNLAVVHLQVSLAQGRKKLKPEDIGINDPNTDLISLGSKKVFDPESLKPFRVLRNEALRICRQEGVRFLGSPNLFAIPLQRVATVVVELDKLQATFNSEKATLLPQVDAINAQWQTTHASFQQALKETFSREYFDRALDFAHHAVRIGPSNDPVLDKNLAQNVGSLSDTLLNEIAEDAMETFKTSFAGQNRCSHKALRPFRRYSAKLRSLGFLNPAALPIADFIDKSISTLPPSGYLEKNDFLSLYFVCQTLSKVENIRAYLNGARKQDTTVGAAASADANILDPETHQAGADAQGADAVVATETDVAETLAQPDADDDQDDTAPIAVPTPIASTPATTVAVPYF